MGFFSGEINSYITDEYWRSKKICDKLHSLFVFNILKMLSLFLRQVQCFIEFKDNDQRIQLFWEHIHFMDHLLEISFVRQCFRSWR